MKCPCLCPIISIWRSVDILYCCLVPADLSASLWTPSKCSLCHITFKVDWTCWLHVKEQNLPWWINVINDVSWHFDLLSQIVLMILLSLVSSIAADDCYWICWHMIVLIWERKKTWESKAAFTKASSLKGQSRHQVLIFTEVNSPCPFQPFLWGMVANKYSVVPCSPCCVMSLCHLL